MKVQINGVGVLGRFGCTLEALKEAAIGKKSPNLGSDGNQGAIQSRQLAPGMQADTSPLSRFFPPASFRRVDHYARMAILAAHHALDDAKRTREGGQELPKPVGVIVATGMGPTAATLDSQAPDADAVELRLSPIQFSNSVHNMAAAYIAMLLNIRGPNVSINQYDMSVPLAFQTAMDWLEEGRAASILVGGVDCCLPNLYDPAACARQDNADTSRQTLTNCEGSAFFVLTRDQKAEARYPRIRDVRIGRNPHDMVLPSNAFFLHSGTGGEAALLTPASRQATFAHVYGAFPSSMVLDLAIGALIRENNPGGINLPNPFALDPAFLGDPRICCLKKGVGGEMGMITLE